MILGNLQEQHTGLAQIILQLHIKLYYHLEVATKQVSAFGPKMISLLAEVFEYLTRTTN